MLDFDELEDVEAKRAADDHCSPPNGGSKATKEADGAANGSRRPTGGQQKDKEEEVHQEEEWDPYAMLGVDADATDAVIKSAFRKASLAVHPDRCPDDPHAARKFRNLAAAKDFLLNPFSRRLYNVRHGLLKQSVTAIWWSDWESIFAEIEPEGKNEVQEESALPRPQAALEPCPGEAPVDILVLGATGLTGTLACMLLQRGLWNRTWAIAGRDGRKLHMLETKFGGSASYRGSSRVETAADLERAVARARVVVDLTGPSHLIGTGAAEAAVRAGKHYVDNTGDVKFSRLVRDQLDAKAKAAGVCMVFHTGYCSLPTDFAVWYMVRYLRDHYGTATRRVRAYDRTAGFVLSGTNYVQGQTFGGENTKDWDFFLLGGARPGGLREEDKDPNRPVYDKITGMWSIQAAVSDRIIVRSSCGLLDGTDPYGSRFNFTCWVPFPDEESASQAVMMTRFVNPKSMPRLAQQQKIPPIGSGPGERMRQECYVTRIYVAEADEDVEEPRVAHCVMHAGPGGFGDRYEGTAAMSVEAACTLLDVEDAGTKDLLRPGWGTPTYHLAHLGFWERLIARGASFKVIEGPPAHQFFQNVLAHAMPIEA